MPIFTNKVSIQKFVAKIQDSYWLFVWGERDIFWEKSLSCYYSFPLWCGQVRLANHNTDLVAVGPLGVWGSQIRAHCFVSSNSFHRQITPKAVH